MDCFDIFVHELLMNTKTKIKKHSNFHKEKKILLNKILKILKNIELKKNWVREFNIYIHSKDTWGYDYFHFIGGEDKYINFTRILHNVNKYLNIDNNEKEFIYQLYNPDKYSSLLNQDKHDEILFDKLENIYYMLIKLYKKEIGKIHRMYYENITYILEEEKSIKEIVKENCIYNDIYNFPLYGINRVCIYNCKKNELYFIEKDSFYNYYRNKHIKV